MKKRKKTYIVMVLSLLTIVFLWLLFTGKIINIRNPHPEWHIHIEKPDIWQYDGGILSYRTTDDSEEMTGIYYSKDGRDELLFVCSGVDSWYLCGQDLYIVANVLPDINTSESIRVQLVKMNLEQRTIDTTDLMLDYYPGITVGEEAGILVGSEYFRFLTDSLEWESIALPEISEMQQLENGSSDMAQPEEGYYLYPADGYYYLIEDFYNGQEDVVELTLLENKGTYYSDVRESIIKLKDHFILYEDSSLHLYDIENQIMLWSDDEYGDFLSAPGEPKMEWVETQFPDDSSFFAMGHVASDRWSAPDYVGTRIIRYIWGSGEIQEYMTKPEEVGITIGKDGYVLLYNSKEDSFYWEDIYGKIREATEEEILLNVDRTNF